MPLFNKKNNDDKESKKKILQYKLVLAEDKPDSVFDLSECGISKVPDGVYAKCKIMQKKFLCEKALILSQNKFDDLKGGGDMNQLNEILVLDLSCNVMKSLNKEIDKLSALQKLDLSNNKIKKLPDSIGELSNLQTLLVNNNDLSYLPGTIKNLQLLEELDITGNKWLASLPPNLCYLRLLKDFRLDSSTVTYPQREITSGGIKEIRRWFKELKGDQFHADDVCDGKRREASSPESSGCCSKPNKLYPELQQPDDPFEHMILERERKKDEEQAQHMRLEQEIADAQDANTRLALQEQDKRQQQLQQIAKQNLEENDIVVKRFEEEDQQRRKLIEKLHMQETRETVETVMQMSARAYDTEAIIEQMEREQSRLDELVKITTEESERLRKQEMIENVKMALQEEMESQRRWDAFEQSQNDTWKKSVDGTNADNACLESIYQEKDRVQQDMIKSILEEEEHQKKAFGILQLQEDVKLKRIKQQVDMIQAELTRLSIMEIEKRKEKEVEGMNILAETRINTAVLLAQLVEEQAQREQRIKETIRQMEEKKDADAKDYWLIQFQRLMDNKPQNLLQAESKLDANVVEMLTSAQAKEYIPHFARHKITWKQMQQLDKQKLVQIGVKDTGIQEMIIATVKSMLIEQGPSRVEVKTPPPSSAPPMLSQSVSGTAHMCSEAECVICMDATPEVVFLQCGHVCTCSSCCIKLQHCPLCRQPIAQMVRLYGI